jgi:hypothetical protein
MPMGNVQKRAGSLFKGKKTKKKFYETRSFNSKQELIQYFISRGKTAAQASAAWERGYRGTTQKKSSTKPPKEDWLTKHEREKEEREEANRKDLSEGKMKDLSHDIKNMSTKEFVDKHKRTKEYFIKILGDPDKPKNKSKKSEPVSEAEVLEGDLIIVPGMRKMKDRSFTPHKQDRRDHEVEMARSDVYAAVKDATRIYKTIKNRTEDQGLMGWQQSYITLAADYLNSVADSLEHDSKVSEMTGGVLAGGMSNFEEDVAEDQINELSPETLASYKKKAGADATAADKRGDYARGNKRMRGIIKATKKQFDKDAKGVTEGFPHDVDHLPGKTIKHTTNTNCTVCHGRKSMYKLDGKLFADNKPGSTKVKCSTCKGTGDKQGVAEEAEQVDEGYYRIRHWPKGKSTAKFVTIQAKDIKQARSIAQNHPHFKDSDVDSIDRLIDNPTKYGLNPHKVLKLDAAYWSKEKVEQVDEAKKPTAREKEAAALLRSYKINRDNERRVIAKMGNHAYNAALDRWNIINGLTPATKRVISKEKVEQVDEDRVSGHKTYQHHDGSWYVEDENENVVLRNASKGEAEHAVYTGNKKLQQGVTEGLIARTDEFKVELDEDGLVHLLDGEETVRVSMPIDIWKRMAGKKGKVDEFSVEVDDGQVHVLDGEETIRVSMPIDIWKQLGKKGVTENTGNQITDESRSMTVVQYLLDKMLQLQNKAMMAIDRERWSELDQIKDEMEKTENKIRRSGPGGDKRMDDFFKNVGNKNPMDVLDPDDTKTSVKENRWRNRLWSPYWSPSNQERKDQSAVDSETRSARRREQSAGLEDEDNIPQRSNTFIYYIRIDGKILKNKRGELFKFNSTAAANKAINTMQSRPWNKDKTFTVTQNPNDDTGTIKESGHQDDQKEREENLRYSRSRADVAGDVRKNIDPNKKEENCPKCGGDMVSEELMNEKKDACYYKVKSRYKVWPSAYASGALVKCRKAGASNWGNKSKNES